MSSTYATGDLSGNHRFCWRSVVNFSIDVERGIIPPMLKTADSCYLHANCSEVRSRSKISARKAGGLITESKSNAHFTGWEIFVPYVGYTNYLVFVLFPWTEKVE